MNYRDNPFKHTLVHRTDPTGRHQMLHDPYTTGDPFWFVVLGAVVVLAVFSLGVYLVGLL